MQRYIARFTSEQEWIRDREAEAKERELRQYEERDYWQERERWDSWEERGANTGCPWGNPDEKGRDMDDNFYEAMAMIEEDRKEPEKVTPYKTKAMSKDRIAYRAALLSRHLARA